ncbi:nucleotidyltransferase domain-containing protein [Mixta gaviniae]|nr:nucleotidyltransferase domain-containing protein [Mixta gaviniae]
MEKDKMETDTGVSAAMRARVRQALRETEQRYQVRILYACESGSRGWGFASPDSDYDVRFIYVHQPAWYLQVEPGRDVIELPPDPQLDICGWELRKTLGLLKRANPTLMEWLDSPIVYQQEEETLAQLRTQAADWFSDLRARYHYLSMAQKNFRGYLQGERVRLKKYLYVLRPLLAVRWIEAGRGAPPMRFHELLAGTVDKGPLLAEIHQLLALKQRSGEAEYGAPLPLIEAFIRQSLAEARPPLADGDRHDDAPLNRLLLRAVMSATP